MHADRTNRAALIVFALLLLIAGCGGLVASTGAVDSSLRRKHLFDNAVSREIGRDGAWLWPVVAVACLLLLLLCLWWLLTLLVSTDRAGDVAVAAATRRDTTTISSGALADALVREIETYRGAEAAKARLIGDSDDPELIVRVTLAGTADAAELIRRIEAEALAHARQALGRPDLAIQLDLDISTRAPERVR